MMGIAAGLALSGKVPFASTYSVFCPGRNWDQIRISVAYNKTNVKFTGAHAGVSVGADGATHQGLERYCDYSLSAQCNCFWHLVIQLRHKKRL